MKTEPRTFGDLKNSPWGEAPLRGRTVRDEIRTNLLARLAAGGPLFPGIVGYEDTILPQIANALLARHHFILLGLRGQAKSRILRQLIDFLDEKIPIVAGSEVNDDPFNPISKYAREMLAECGDATPIAWLRRDQRYVDKRSGVSQRLPISVLEHAVSNAERRAMQLGEDRIVPRVSDVYAAVPSITGKLELEYEGELQGGDTIARELIRRAAGKVMEERLGGADTN